MNENLKEQESTVYPLEGLGPLLIGCVLFLTAPLTASLAAHVWAYSDKAPNVVLFHAWLARLSVPMIFVVGITNITMAHGARNRCLANNQSTVLSNSGMLMAYFGFLLWVITAIALLDTTESMLNLYS